MNEMNKLAKDTMDDIKAIEKHPTFKPYTGFKARIVSSPSQGGNIRLPKKQQVKGSK